ncbi:hypothetical protein CGGC5_v017122 [Colletotrichum fructicola Nara gc5]|uniref:Uncharacterized protein n=1 Tax=Colletotrichum fructicola (strain Nara gc5) TaxID=1213859 RepID=A0A7J6IE65_COLFN|nr:hypothetical protein CGGC5_v017122 [Colletotrichum fructicola Nara gc5]
MDALSPIRTPVDLRCSLCSQRAMFALTLSCCQSLICGYCTYNRHVKCLRTCAVKHFVPIHGQLSHKRADDFAVKYIKI